MNNRSNNKEIEIRTVVNASKEKVWAAYTSPVHIVKWNNASEDWHAPHAENDLKAGGRFLTRMEAKDGSYGFDFAGTFDEVKPMEHIAYTLDDGRKVKVDFKTTGDMTEVVQTFEAEETMSTDAQMRGWQAILDNFRKYAETGI